MSAQIRHEQREALKSVAVALKAAEVPFALAGSYAAWARGGPENEHDVDFVIPNDDRDRALDALRSAGIVPIANSEDWLVKVAHGDVVVDLIGHLPHACVNTSLLGRAETLRVESVEMPVLSATDVVISKVLAYDEHHCDFATCLAIARALREQLAIEDMNRELSTSPFGRAFLGLLDSLEILRPCGEAR